MNLSDIQKNVLKPEVDQTIADYLKTDSCLVVYEWIEKHITMLRSWALYELTGTNLNDPKITAQLVSNYHSHDKSIYDAYCVVDYMYPLEVVKTPKEKARDRIFSEIGDYDLYDILADISKRVCMIERLLIRLANSMMASGTFPQDIQQLYGDMIVAYMTGLGEGKIRDRTDLEDNYMVFQKLQERTAKIADIVKQELFTE